MSGPPPIPCRFDGEAFAPLPRFARVVAEHYLAGTIYHLTVEKERSPKSHRQFFAIINDVFENLPEHETRWMTAEHMRKWALIKAGYADVATFPCASAAEALRWAPILAAADTYSIVVPRGSVVTRYTAQSIAWASMGHKDFQACKDAVFRILADLIDVEPTLLDDRMRQAA